MDGDWKQAKCGACEYWVPGERPRQRTQGRLGSVHDVPILDGPRSGRCRYGPPAVVVLGGRQTPQGMELQTAGQYPPVDDGNEACSRFVKALNLVEA
jgi:hypothetical protein